MAYTGETLTLYDQNAGNWVRNEPCSLSDYTGRQRVLDLCEPVAGRRILDLGCGEGYCSRILRRRGAQVLGVDISKEMIERACEAEKSEGLGVAYAVHDAAQMRLSEKEFDLVVAVFLLNYLDVDQMRKTMRNVYSTLRPGGHFIFAVPHPAFPFMRKPSAPFYFNIGNAGYFSSRNTLFPGQIWKRDGLALDVQLVHKTLEDYFEALVYAGFDAMPTLLELRVTEAMVELDPDFFSPIIDVPLHLGIKVARG
jgi:2-polyprenyl-3-methyl-5-hydroxy-6-metoxy-1,4-benzoquinol methylase